MADLQAARAAKRAHAGSSTTAQFAGPPRPSIEDVEDEDEDQTHQSDHNAHNAANIQRRDQIASTMNAAGAEVEKTSSRVVKAPPQVSRNTQSGKIQDLIKEFQRPGSEISAEQSVTQAGSSVRPASTAVDLTGSDDEEDEGNGVSQGESSMRELYSALTNNSQAIAFSAVLELQHRPTSSAKRSELGAIKSAKPQRQLCPGAPTTKASRSS